ncbi:MAG: class I SAM-dependent methyltransferase [Bacteroidales bacterium]|jgi:2-polyprenyl-3-methyl-5-hydroxy-6-metoxy-1,4-benzoquinol methylase|nr:class I SAM-dependent methyltransferase [Bacteroidales bacterium]
MEKLNSCPVCGNSELTSFLSVADHFLTQKVFSIQQCGVCGLKFVNPRPQENEMDLYYQTDDYISHNAQKNNLTSRIYRIARVVSIRRKYRIIKTHTNADSLLDIGCGTGEFLHYCKGKNIKVYGLEPNSKARNFARESNHLSVSEKLSDFDGATILFDCITMWHVLEHIHALNETLTIVKKMLQPQGILIVAVPNCNSWDARHFKQFWAAYDVPRHLYHFAPSSFIGLVGKHGFDVKAILPQKLDAYYISLLSEKYRSGEFNYFKAVLTGFRSNFLAHKTKTGTSSLIFILTPKIT